MGIDREQLYGATTTAAEAQGAAQVASFRIPRAEPPPAPLILPFLALSVAVDNVTGRWWQVAGRWIPPWTVGAVVPVAPPSAALDVVAVTPIGQLSEATGAELVLVASSAEQPASAGVYSPARLGFSLLTVSAEVTATTSGGPPGLDVIVPAPAAGHRYALVSATARCDWDTANRHGLSRILVGWTAPTFLVTALAELVVGFDSPRDEQRYEPPVLWPTPAEAGTGNAGIVLIAQQAASNPPAELLVRLAYLLLVAS